MNEPTPSRWGRLVGELLPSLRRTALIAVLCNLSLELSQLTGVDGYPWRHKTPTFLLLFLLGSLVLWAVVGLVHALVGRLWLTTALMAAGTVVVAVADYEKVRLRGEPVYPSDWEFAGDIGFLAQAVGVQVVVLIGSAVLSVGAAALAVARIRRSRRPVDGDGLPRAHPRDARVVARVLSGSLCLLALSYVADFNAPGNAARGAYDVLGASWKPWSQQRNYLGNGFVGGILYNLDVPTMPRPAGYSAAAMSRVTARYAAAAERINRTRDLRGLDEVNVVMILSESFSDPTALDGVHLAKDPIPFTRRLMRTTTSGSMLAQNVGGGTASMEFEALTGMSLSQFPAQVRVPYQMLVPEYVSFPSAVGWFKRTGHRAVAVHPFTTEMYRRREVYQRFGFDEFVYDQKMRDTSRSGQGGFISDEAAFDEVRGLLESQRRPLFVNLVTMQNHMPYAGRYVDPVQVTSPHGDPMPEIGHYVRGLTHSDRALADLVDGLSRLPEPTMVVFYGDHLPGSYPEDVFEANGRAAMHQTPFFVWANFPGPTEAQPVTSPIHFMDLLLERADAAVPPYYALLHELRQEIPAADSGMMFDSTGRPTRHGRLSTRAARLLRDYRLVQYDLSVGERYSEDAMFGHATALAASSATVGE